VPTHRKVLGIFGRKSRPQEEILTDYDLANAKLAVLPALEIE